LNPEVFVLMLFAGGAVVGGLSLFVRVSGPFALALAFVPVAGLAFSTVFC
jgi:hypothetical protein